MKIHTPQKKYTKVIIVLLTILLLGAVSYGVYAKITQTWPFVATPEKSSTRGVGDVDYSPPTEQEVKDSQNAKQRGDTETQPETPAQTNGDKATIPVAISSAAVIDGNLEIRAFTPRIIEGSGECTATISNSGKTVTATSAAFIDTSSSICRPILVDISKLASGTWQVSVDYSSPDAKGTSQSVTVDIP